MYFLPKWWAGYDAQYKRFTAEGIEELRTKLAAATNQPYTSRRTGGNGNSPRRTQTHPAQATQPTRTSVSAPAGDSSHGTANATDFWKTAKPLIGSKFQDLDSVKALVASHTDSGGVTNWDAALQSLN